VLQFVWWRPGEQIRLNQLSTRKTLAREAESGTIKIKTDERTISGANRGENATCAATKFYS
jgi:hypothetical protein